MLSEQDHKVLEERFETSLVNDVTLRLFTQSAARSLLTIPGKQAQNNDFLKVTLELLEELVELSPKLSLQVLDVNGDGAAAAKSMGIEQIPAIVLGDDPEGRMRFYGAPVGNEFPTILTGIESISQQAPMLQDYVMAAAQQYIDEPVHLRVFVTPT
jgi:alkyl hydroperoxide reductase subunit AhpF